MFGVGYERWRQESPQGQRKMFRSGQGIYTPSSLEHLAQMTKSELMNLAGELNETLGSVLRNFDADGQILKRVPYACRIYIDVGGTNTTIPNNTWTAIEWQDIDLLTDSKMFDTGDNTKITITQSGWYFMGANANLKADIGDVRRLAIRRNGSSTDEDWLVRSGISLTADYFGGGSAGFSVMTVDYMEAGDYIEALFYQSDASSASSELNIAEGHPRFMAYLIDPKIQA